MAAAPERWADKNRDGGFHKFGVLFEGPFFSEICWGSILGYLDSGKRIYEL